MSLQLSTSVNPPSFSDFPNLLVDMGYRRVPMVLSPGDFSVRGSIVDIFPVNHEWPIRIDYFDDEIDRLVSFDTQTQRSLSEIETTTIFPVDTSLSKWLNPRNDLGIDSTLLSQFSVGDTVVHETYGLGRFDGLKRMNLRGYESEYVQLTYAEGGTVYVPLDQLSRLYRYTGTGSLASLNRLGDGRWQTTKKRAQRATLLFVESLYETYQKRMTLKGKICKEDSEFQLLFESKFPFDLTEDQVKALNSIKSDMEASQPMDHLLCGDVGYGKTEVIMCAAFKAIDNHFQVVVMVPTTLLATQHYETFKERFKSFPVKMALLTRFTSPSEYKQILRDLRSQTLDLVIGTHRLLSQSIKFKNLGLFVVDEEQRFGVSHKEQIKERYPSIDYLSVSATPIPRTLSFSLSGMKSFSNIETPPLSRKPVLTCVEPFSSDLVKEAIERELARKGQVFYLHNRVDRLMSKCTFLKGILPGIRVGIVHARMPILEIDKRMHSFRSGELDVLLSTTIIENGLDLPNANTIVMDGVERLGLSQIHQLRGRVGRTSRQGYAYLLYDGDMAIKEDAMKRLEAIREYTFLGAGYQLALRDLEIRGSGTLLGHHQSGHVTSVGFDLYMHFLSQAFSGSFDEDQFSTWSVDALTQQAYLPASYISDAKERLAVYDRLSSVSSVSELASISEELSDRYGDLPFSVGLFFKGIAKQLSD